MKTHTKKLNLNIYTQIRHQIISGAISPSSKLSENLLSKNLGVSRTPVREALLKLENEGFLIYNLRRGFSLNTITIEDIKKLYPIKISLEGLAGRLATPIVSNNENDLEYLKKLLKEMGLIMKENDINAYVAKNYEFHSYFWHSCQNERLIRMLERLNMQVDRFIVKALYVPKRMEKSFHEHLEIYRQIETGDEKAVEKAIAIHFENASEDLKKVIIKDLPPRLG